MTDNGRNDRLEETIIARARAGDDRARRAIVAAWATTVADTIHRIVGGLTREESEDIAGDVFAELFRSLERYQIEDGAFASWIYRIVCERCRARRARLAAEPAPPGEIARSRPGFGAGDHA